ncbi:hypothetical protein THAOC_34201, partial [Thalassiosira oceanica]
KPLPVLPVTLPGSGLPFAVGRRAPPARSAGSLGQVTLWGPSPAGGRWSLRRHKLSGLGAVAAAIFASALAAGTDHGTAAGTTIGNAWHRRYHVDSPPRLTPCREGTPAGDREDQYGDASDRLGRRGDNEEGRRRRPEHEGEAGQLLASVEGPDLGGVGSPPPRLSALPVIFAVRLAGSSGEMAAVGRDEEAVGRRPGGVLARWLDRNCRVQAVPRGGGVRTLLPTRDQRRRLGVGGVPAGGDLGERRLDLGRSGLLAACFFEITLGLSKGVSDSTVLGKTESVAAVDTGGTESQSSLSGTNIAEDDATKTQQAAEGVTVAGEEVVKSQSTIPSDLSEAENKSPETQRTIAGETIFKSPLSHPPEPSEAATEILKIRQSVAGEEVSKSQPIAAGNASTIGVQDLQPSDGTLNSSRDVSIVGRDGDLQNDDSTDEEAARKMVPTDEDAVSEEDSSPNEIWDDKPPNDLWDLLELAGWTVLAIGLLKVVMYLREVEQEIKDANVAEKKQREEGASKLEEERAARSARRKALFGEPRPLAECPLCMNAMPFDVEERRYFLCCGKTTCMSCYTHYAFNAEANRMRRQNDNGHNEPVDLPCPFCRCSEEMDLDEESVLSERIEKSELNGCFDHQAAFELGQHHYDSAYYGSDWKASAMKWWKKAAKHGNELAAYELALIYTGSEHAKFTVREQADLGKSYMEEAAIAGHPKARYWLGLHEMNQERAMSHFTLAARYGCKTSLDLVVKGYRSGIVTREDLDEVLRGHQDATPS